MPFDRRHFLHIVSDPNQARYQSHRRQSSFGPTAFGGKSWVDSIQQFFVVPRFILHRIVAPVLKQRIRDEAIANHGPAQWVREHSIAPHRIQVPIVSDLVIVEHHVGGYVGECASDFGNASQSCLKRSTSFEGPSARALSASFFASRSFFFVRSQGLTCSFRTFSKTGPESSPSRKEVISLFFSVSPMTCDLRSRRH